MLRLIACFCLLALCPYPASAHAASASAVPASAAPACPFPPPLPAGGLRAAWLGSAVRLPQNYSPEQRALHLEAVYAFITQFNRLNDVYGLTAPLRLIADETGEAAAGEAETGAAALLENARRLAARTDLDLILISGPEALAAIADARRDAGGLSAAPPLLVLTPDCPLPQLRELVPGSAWPEDGLLAPADSFWRTRLEDYAGAARFRRLGLISPAGDAPLADRAVALALRRQAETIAAGGGFEVFGYDELRDTSPEQCREAIDYLFFDEIDALVLDGYGCFEPERSDYAELTELLRQRGIFPLSAYDASLTGHGAMLAPAPGEGERLGRAFAAQVFAALLKEAASGRPAPAGPGKLPAQGAAFTGVPARLPGGFAPGLPLFSINLSTAGSMGFDPPAALIAVSLDAGAP